MYDGKQVVRIVNNYKKDDIYKVGVEMTDRKGTGNYEPERTQFNVEYVSLTEKNLYQEVKATLKKRNIEFNNKPTTNMLNGITFTSGPEFFQTLGMNFKDSGRTYHKGDKQGQAVMIPDIKSKEDIPNAVSYYFDSCMDFLKEYVGEENILLAQIHYDEDTPHLQAYFVPVVNKVKRKCYEKDKDGNVVKEEFVRKDGTISLTPKLLRDDKGKIIYEEVDGKFLNCDQFWKDRGGTVSFHKLQNEFNKFITERGFNLYRGDIGSHKENQTKLEYDIEEKKAELEELNKEKENVLKIIENSKNGLKNIDTAKDKEELLNPVKRKVIGYKDEDISKLSDYTKELQKKVILLETENTNKDIKITKLTEENKTFKNNSELIKKNKVIKEQKEEITRLNNIVEILDNQVKTIQRKFNDFKEDIYNFCDKMCRALGHLIGIHISKNNKNINYDDFEYEANKINKKYEYKEKDKSDDFELGM